MGNIVCFCFNDLMGVGHLYILFPRLLHVVLNKEFEYSYGSLGVNVSWEVSVQRVLHSSHESENESVEFSY